MKKVERNYEKATKGGGKEERKVERQKDKRKKERKKQTQKERNRDTKSEWRGRSVLFDLRQHTDTETISQCER